MLPASTRIWVCLTPLDMRKSFDGMAVAVREILGKDPESDGLFVFCNKRGNRLKAMWWDRTGYALMYKRLEWGFFRIPEALAANATSVHVDVKELSRILEGIGLPPKKHRKYKDVVDKRSDFTLQIQT